MAFLTALDDHDVDVIARAFGLGEVVGVHAVAGGTISSNFAFDFLDPREHQRRVFVRMNDGKDPAVVAWESSLVDELAAAGVPTPPPLPAAGGGHVLHHRGHAITAFPWCVGRHLAPGDVEPGHAAAIGRALADLHVAGLRLAPDRRRAGIYQFADIVRRFDGFRARDDAALAPAIAVLADELAWLAAQAAVRAAATQGLVHGDLFRDNVLWQGPRLIAVLDFEQASGGSFAYDLAVVLNDWAWAPRAGDPARGGAPRPSIAAAIIAGYQEGRPLTAADRAALPVEVRAAAARFTITRVTDVYLRQLDNPDKDFRAFLARLVAWRGPELGALLSSV